MTTSQTSKSTLALQSRDKDSLQILLDQVLELKDNPAFQECLMRFSRLQEQCQRELEASTEMSQVFRFQGQLLAYRKASSVINDLRDEIKRIII